MPPLYYIRLSHFSCKMHFGMNEKSVLSPLKPMQVIFRNLIAARGACGAYGGGERCAQGSGGET